MLYNFLKVIVDFFFKIIFNYNVYGIENYNELNEEDNIVLCSNHQAYFDPVSLALAIDEPIHYMAKEELFDVPILGFLIKNLYAFPVERGANDIKALKTAVNVVKEGNILGIFIEGTRVKEYNPDNAKKGPVIIANLSKSKILPVYIDTDYKLFGKVNVHIREAMEIDLDKFSGSKNEKYDKQAKEILHKIYYG